MSAPGSLANRLLIIAVTGTVLVLPSGRADALGAADAGYGLRPTVVCLKHRGGIVGAVKPVNARMRALRDLAQKAAVQTRVRGAVVGMAFTRSTHDASLLFELLTVPKDPMRLEQRKNVVLLSPRRAWDARAVAIRCLRP